MASNSTVFVNDQDLAALGFSIELLKGPWDGMSVTPGGTPIPGRVGQMSPAADPGGGARTIELSGWLRGATNTDVVAKLHALKARMPLGTTVEVRRVDDPTLMYLARRVALTPTPFGPPLIATSYELSVTLLCDDPNAYDIEPTVLKFAQVRRPIPLGTGTSVGVIRIAPDPVSGTAVDPIVTYRHANGDVLWQMAFSRTLAAADYLEIDLALFQATRSVANVRTNDLSALLANGYFNVLSPLDGDPANGVWPTLEVSAGDATLVYRRRWE